MDEANFDRAHEAKVAEQELMVKNCRDMVSIEKKEYREGCLMRVGCERETLGYCPHYLFLLFPPPQIASFQSKEAAEQELFKRGMEDYPYPPPHRGMEGSLITYVQ
jgi:hypothetical protein